MHTFEVSDVISPTGPLPSTSLQLSIQQLLGSPVEASASNCSQLASSRIPGLLGAAHEAFAGHYPLVLSPDDIWMCIAQGFARHVELNAEALKDRFTRASEVATLTVRRDDFIAGSPDNDWEGCFAEFSDQISQIIGKKRDLVVADFSTTGPVERAATEVVLMSSMQEYLSYEVLTLCGIPRITLSGTVEDWMKIRARVHALSEFDLEWWTAGLVPILDEFVSAASGAPTVELWRCFYKWNDDSGGPHVSGWINTLYPYLEVDSALRGFEFRAGEKPVPRRNEFATDWSAAFREPRHTGPRTSEFPTGLCRVPFVWRYFGDCLDMEFVAGFVGCGQRSADLAIRPAIGWGVHATKLATSR